MLAEELASDKSNEQTSKRPNAFSFLYMLYGRINKAPPRNLKYC